MKKYHEGSKEILVIPIGKVMVDILNEITVALRKTYQCHVKLGRSEEPATDCYSDERRQFDADKLSGMLISRKSPKLIAVIGIVDADIFYGDKAFVFGMNKPNNGVALFSLTRLRNEFYGKPADIEKLMQRGVKEAIYQVAMAGNLKNCTQKKCILSAGTALWRLDDKSSKFCEMCQKKVEVRLLEKKVKQNEVENESDEALHDEGPDGQPQMMGQNEAMSNSDSIEDENKVAEEIVEPEGPAAAELEAIHSVDDKLDEPLDANTQG